jgi:RimJ/RimL family protein N-acetyltransferase
MPLPRLTTARLCLRARSREDLDDILEMDIDPEVYRFSEIRRGYQPPDRSLMRKTIRRELLSGSSHNLWAIEWLHQRGLLGLIGFSAGKLFTNVLSFRLVRSAWGQGVATEAAHAVLDHGFQVLRLPLIEAFAHQQNKRSHRVLTKIGMKQDGIAALLERSPLSVPVAPGSLPVPANSSAGEMYLSYSMDRASYVSGAARIEKNLRD